MECSVLFKLKRCRQYREKDREIIISETKIYKFYLYLKKWMPILNIILYQYEASLET